MTFDSSENSRLDCPGYESGRNLSGIRSADLRRAVSAALDEFVESIEVAAAVSNDPLCPLPGPPPD